MIRGTITNGNCSKCSRDDETLKHLFKDYGFAYTGWRDTRNDNGGDLLEMQSR